MHKRVFCETENYGTKFLKKIIFFFKEKVCPTYLAQPETFLTKKTKNQNLPDLLF